MIKLLFSLFFFVVFFSVKCQLVSSDTLFINQGAVFHVNSELVNQNYLQNKGEVFIKNDIVNDGILIGGVNNCFIKINNNWVNNGINQHNNMVVQFAGADQQIRGTVVPVFNKLDLVGNGYKSLLIDAKTNELNLYNNEFATQGFILSVLSPDINSILFNNGFVSSLDSGRLERKTNTMNEYVFPVGSSINGIKYRPVYLTPSTTNTTMYGIRLVNGAANALECPSDVLAQNISKINNSYYHHVYSNSNVVINLTFQYNQFEDGNWSSIAQWKGNEWLGLISSDNTNEIEISVSDFYSRNFVLANQKETIYIPNSFTPNGDGVNDIFSLNVSEIAFDFFEFEVFNRWGERIFKTIEKDFKWNGEYLNKPIPGGVYVWKIKYKETGNIEVESNNGTVTIIK